MKTKNRILTAILIAIVSITFAQPYQEKVFHHNDVFLTDGRYCRINSNPGFLMAGVTHNALANTPNFYIDRTNIKGTFPGAAWEFVNDYLVQYPFGACGGSPAQAINIVGISAIETSLSSPTRHYAIAGVIDDEPLVSGGDGAAFFATLDASGTVVDQMMYKFPSGYSHPTKPILVESSSTGEYFICGSYSTTTGNIMYVLNVDDTGAIIDSKNYIVGGFFLELTPKDMMLSPYANEIAIVGSINNTGGSAGFLKKGFFIRIDVSNLNNVDCRLYGQTPAEDGISQDWFSSINVAASTNLGSDGFVIGGHSDLITNQYLWMLKIDPVGAVIWNSVFEPKNDNTIRLDAISVLERESMTYGYTYYAAVTSTAGMMAIKLDDNGASFQSATPVDNFNEFIYASGGPDPEAFKIGYLDNAASNDIGIHVYGVGHGSIGGEHYLVEAAFNGYTDAVCMPSTSYIDQILSESQGPAYTSTPGIDPVTGLDECSNIIISTSPNVSSSNVFCSADPLPSLGSNAKTTNLSKELTDESSSVDLYPNPTNNKIGVSFTANSNELADFELLDLTGRVITNFKPYQVYKSGRQLLELDLCGINIEIGTYFLKIKINRFVTLKKIVIVK